MATLHIEHGITDYLTWKAAFDRYADKRRKAGVIAHRIHHLFDSTNYIVVQLDFPTIEQARAFRDFLDSEVWTNPANAPALVGRPMAWLLVEAPEK